MTSQTTVVSKVRKEAPAAGLHNTDKHGDQKQGDDVIKNRETGCLNKFIGTRDAIELLLLGPFPPASWPPPVPFFEAPSSRTKRSRCRMLYPLVATRPLPCGRDPLLLSPSTSSLTAVLQEKKHASSATNWKPQRRQCPVLLVSLCSASFSPFFLCRSWNDLLREDYDSRW